MKVKQFLEKLQENWPAKVICFIVALMIYIFYQMSTLDTKSFNVPLKVSSGAGFLPVGKYQSHVKIVAKGKKDDLATVNEKDFEVFLDLTGCTQNGKQKFPVLLGLSEKLILLENVEYKTVPESIEILVEEQISDYSEVKPLIYGEAAKGYYIESIKLTPSKVKITGPKSMVESCNRLQTSRVNVEGASVPLSQKVKVENAGDFLKLTETSEITVEVKILPKKDEKTFKNIPVTIENLNPGLEVKSKSEISCTIVGNQNDMEKFIPATGNFVLNLKDITEAGTYELQPVSRLPSKYQVSFKENVKIEIVIHKDDEINEPVADFSEDGKTVAGVKQQ